MPAINDIFTGTVRDITSEGAGVVKHDSGQVFFVPGVWLDETAEFRVTGFKKRNGFAELVRLIESSPDRVTPPCPHHGFGVSHCGGCGWQFVSVDAQLRQKEERIRQAMARLGLAEKVKPIIASPLDLGYRNRAQFKTDGRELGYMAANSNRLAAITDCPILTEKNQHTLRQLLQSLPNNAWRPRKKGQWTSIDIDEDIELANLEINRRRPFRQANTQQNHCMRRWLADRLEDADHNRPVLELFAGSGNFTETIAGAEFAEIIAVEGEKEAVDYLNQRALPGVEGEVVNLFNEKAVAALAYRHASVGTLVLDPPREGFKAIQVLLQGLPHLNRVVYISCNPSTFVRDLEVVREQGFELEEIQPLDMFPHTPHIEILAYATMNR